MQKHIQEYLRLLRALGHYLGDVKKDEIQIITDPDKIMEAEKQKKEENINLPFTGQVPNWRSGIISMDQYFTFLRDPVLFPGREDGTQTASGLYNRVIYSNEVRGAGGVCIAPITQDCKIVMNVVFRHSIRCLTIEVPGTISRIGETIHESILRCLKMEMDIGETSVAEIHQIGQTISERGLLGAKIPVFAVRVKTVGSQIQDAMVRKHLLMSLEDLKEHRRKGEIYIDGIKHLVSDSFTDSALILLDSYEFA